LRPVFIISLLVIIVVSTLLVSSSSVLVIGLGSDPYIPLGNILTWIGMIAFPISIYSGIFYKILKLLLFIAILLTVFWGVVSFYLADNWSANFGSQEGFRGSTRAANYFWNYNYLVVGLPLILLITFWISRIIAVFRR
jgi:hypothetical protein